MENKEMLKVMEEVGQTLSYLISKTEKLVEDVEVLKQRHQHSHQPWMSLEELIDYLPTHPSSNTIYQWVRHNRIPHHKLQGALIFRRSDIDEWIVRGTPETLQYDT